MAENKNGLAARIESEAKAIKPTTNADLICKDCLLRFDDTGGFPGNVAKCEYYPWEQGGKPNEILLGGKECEGYVKE